MEENFYVYIVTNKPNGTLYVGITNDLGRRIWEHKMRIHEGFTAKYGLDQLVWHEPYPTALEAIAHEKRLKRWRRVWKLALIEKHNPQWRDLYETLNQ